MRLCALVTSALRMMKVSPCVGGCHVRGSPLLPPGRSVPATVGGNGALLSGPSAPGSGPFLEGVDPAGGIHHPPAPIRALGTREQAGAVGVPPLRRLVNIPSSE